MSNSFDDLMSDPEISERVKDRLRFLKKERNLPSNDDMLFVLAEFGFLNKLWADIPRQVELAAQGAIIKADADVTLFASQAIKNVSTAGVELNAAIEKSAVEATGKITRAVIDEMHGAISQRNKIDDMIKGAENKLVVLATITSAVVFKDLVNHAQGAIDDLPAKYSDIGHFINYLCNIPIGAAVVPLVLYLIITILLKWFDQWGDENVTRINENGGFVGIAKRMRDNQK